jgi:hypothetical protein
MRSAVSGASRVEPGITPTNGCCSAPCLPRLLPPGFPVRQQRFDLRRRVLSTTASSDLRLKDFKSRKWWWTTPATWSSRCGFGDDDAPDPTEFVPT